MVHSDTQARLQLDGSDTKHPFKDVHATAAKFVAPSFIPLIEKLIQQQNVCPVFQIASHLRGGLVVSGAAGRRADGRAECRRAAVLQRWP